MVNSLAKHSQLQKLISVRYVAATSRDPFFNQTLLGTCYVRPNNTMGKVANPGKTSSSRKRKHKVGYPTAAETDSCTTASGNIFETTIEDATDQTELDRQILSNQLKLQWELNCQKITEAGNLCGTLCDQECVSLLYLSIGTEGRRLLTQKFPHDNIYDL